MNVDLNVWVSEVKEKEGFDRAGMILCHNGVVRAVSRDGRAVTGMILESKPEMIAEIIERSEAMPGIFAVRLWVNQGSLAVGDDIMYALVAGDIRDNVIEALRQLVATVKSEVLKETELYE